MSRVQGTPLSLPCRVLHVQHWVPPCWVPALPPSCHLSQGCATACTQLLGVPGALQPL